MQEKNSSSSGNKFGKIKHPYVKIQQPQAYHFKEKEMRIFCLNFSELTQYNMSSIPKCSQKA
jgi:hypothetical protein